MENFELINLLAITIVYSTFVAPAVSSLNDIRDDIAKITFPPPNNSLNPSDDKELLEAGDLLEKKLTLYTLKYRTLKKSLKYFNTIAIVVVLWAVMGLTTEWLNSDNNNQILGWAFVILLAVFFVYRAVSTNISSPNKVRSVQWLTKEARINPNYFRKLSNLRLIFNYETRSVKDSSYWVEISMEMSRSFTGQKYILLFESDDKQSGDFVAFGNLNNDMPGYTTYYAGGAISSVFLLGESSFRPGQWKIKLYIFDGALNIIGAWNPVYFETKPTIQEKSVKETHSWEINQLNNAKNIQYGGNAQSIKELKCVEAGTDETVAMLLGIKSFRKQFVNSKKPVYFQDMHGFMDRSSVVFAFRKDKILIRKLISKVSRKKVIRI